MLYLQLFWSFFQIGLFSIGGGYAAMPLIQNQVVDLHHWLTLSEFTDLITISQMTPGPIAINSATFVGIRIGGVGGALVSTLGCILPSLIIVMTLAYFYTKYKNIAVIQPAPGGGRPYRVGRPVHRHPGLLGGRRLLPEARRSQSGGGGPVCRGAVCPAQMEAQPHLGDAGQRRGRSVPIYLAVAVSLFRNCPLPNHTTSCRI